MGKVRTCYIFHHKLYWILSINYISQTVKWLCTQTCATRSFECCLISSLWLTIKSVFRRKCCDSLRATSTAPMSFSLAQRGNMSLGEEATRCCWVCAGPTAVDVGTAEEDAGDVKVFPPSLLWSDPPPPPEDAIPLTFLKYCNNIPCNRGRWENTSHW